MKNNHVKKLFAAILSVLMLAVVFTACGEAKETELNFKNELPSDLLQIFISPIDSLTWEDENLINSAKVYSGSTIRFDFSKFGGEDGGTYDIGTYDVNKMNYDCYDVVLHIGDNIALRGDANEAQFIVTHADGTSDTYTADVFADE